MANSRKLRLIYANKRKPGEIDAEKPLHSALTVAAASTLTNSVFL